jgi:hexosaminidase
VWKQEPSFIYLPKSVEVYTSVNGYEWSKPFTATPVNDKWPDERKITVKLPANVTANYVKIIANNLGTIPEGKPGAGRKAWLFVDELEVN